MKTVSWSKVAEKHARIGIQPAVDAPEEYYVSYWAECERISMQDESGLVMPVNSQPGIYPSAPL